MQRFLIMLSVLFILTLRAFAQASSDYLILQDIGSYKIASQESKLPDRSGPEADAHGPGILGRAGHYSADHADTTYRVTYIGGDGMPSPTVVVTQHAGSDSDQWLLHEIDWEFRNSYGMPEKTYGPRQINGYTIMENDSDGGCYRWLSGKKVVQIEYRDSKTGKAEPLDVVKAYLIKHPSTLSEKIVSQMNSAENVSAWIRDEMDRRLWLAEKWLSQIQPSGQLGDKLRSATDSMVVFLNFREKYFGMNAKDDKIALAAALKQNNVAAAQARMTNYKTWWTSHKGDAIALP